ncbi:TPA: HK97 family phage prohead protease [Aeromonas dhakensis]|uniref:HK97 family phage prohead protease n=1 Tax=Aeromonas dhakensis TaxID=196024 RepID=UPI00288D6EF9|nr:HK97 family phage prohead protease [Aeromonas dhakensis]HDX8469016.1 HK97 family phage prohead protease [Aeromonas dhakensis]HDZ8869531.1 HK97 family phage prohead protease [Aeromonas dhakensis]HDZ8931151.1 HK97 family phage prohead protease [Aeromonas dhakensis]HEA3208357.1 HK97 family phage prohead protease [Aeromonas dhakensis]
MKKNTKEIGYKTLRSKSQDFSEFALTETGEFTCYANTFNFEDWAGDVTLPGAFDDSIMYHREMGTMPQFFFNHDHDQIVGKWLEMSVDENGLLMKGKINLDTDIGKRIYQQMKHGDLNSFSIGYDVIEEHKEDGINYLVILHVFEVSVVSIPCNEQSLLIDIKNRFGKKHKKDLIVEGGDGADELVNEEEVKQDEEDTSMYDILEAFLEKNRK